LFFYGIEFPERFNESGSHWSRAFMQWQESLPLDEGPCKKSLEMHLKGAEYLRKLIYDSTKKVRHLATSKFYDEDSKLLITIPGIGVLTAMCILTEIKDMKRFKRLEEVFSL